MIRRWNRLPGTAAEAASAEREFARLCGGPPTVYTGRLAGERAVKAIARPRYVLFSTHGFFRQASRKPAAAGQKRMPTRGLDLPEDDTATPIDSMATNAQSLIECGVVLAGANKSDASAEADSEDGFLTGLEVLGLDLRGTELAILSACETGVGEIRIGEGLADLRYAFQAAGAKNVLASLWKIPDEATAQFIGDFLATLSPSSGKADVLRRSQLKHLVRRRAEHGSGHPFYWSAFSLTETGEAANVDANQKGPIAHKKD